MLNTQQRDHRATIYIKPAHKQILTDADVRDLSDQAKRGSQLFQTPVLSALQAEDARLRALSVGKITSQSEDAPTEPLDEDAPDIISILFNMPPGFRIGDVTAYTPLPAHERLLGRLSDALPWRIELHGLAPGVGPVGLDILGDVVLGRGPDADFDLEPYRGYEQAVSRCHALLRPTRRQLHLIDLTSTNGTFYNTIPLGRAATYALRHNDVITLGLLTFTIKIIDGPQMA